LLMPDVNEYFSQLNAPSEQGHGKVPLNPMNVPTNSSFTYKSYNSVSASINANTATSFDFFPGHAEAQAADPLDLVSAHAKTQRVGALATDYVVGPTTDGIFGTCIMGVATSALALDTFPASSNTAGSTVITAAEVAPFTASDSDGNHTRWRLQSLEVVVENVSTLQNLGGDIVVVQPDHSSDATAVGTYMKYSSFRRHNAMEPVKVQWLPRTRDLMWWHSQHTTADTALSEVGLRILLNNSTANAQQYRVDFIANWEVSGARYAQLSTPTRDCAQAAVVVPRAINAARNHTGTTKFIGAHGEVEAAGAHGPGTFGQLASRLARLGSAALKATEQHVTQVIGAGVNFTGKAVGSFVRGLAGKN
jgi:hypothetical protein